MTWDWNSFGWWFCGLGIGLHVARWIFDRQLATMRRERDAFFTEQRKRIDDLAEWSRSSYERARRDVGLPPRSVS